MNEKIEKMIASLLVDENAKAVLWDADRILNSDSDGLRNSAFTPLVIAGLGCGFSSYGRVYSAIVDTSFPKAVKGTATFLELVFPKDNERDENLFFASPRRIASIRNRFYGTMLISFKEYEGQDLIRSTSLKRLLEYMAINKENIRFVLHITPEFSAKENLIAILRDVVNVTVVRLDKPGTEMGYAYVMEELTHQGVSVDEAAKKLIKERAIPKMISRKSYTGYRSLNNFLGRLNIESAVPTENGTFEINASALDSLLERIEREEENRRETKIGFGI